MKKGNALLSSMSERACNAPVIEDAVDGALKEANDKGAVILNLATVLVY